jgi:hypothetical protein
MRCLKFVMIRIDVFTLFISHISVRVCRLTSHKISSVRQITNSLRANLNPLLCVSSSFLRIASDAEPYGSFPHLSALSISIQCILMRFF